MKINRSGILITYKCNAICRHCLYMSNPKKSGLMTVEDARRYFQEFARLGLAGDRIHIAGGEAFIHYDRLLEIVKAGEYAHNPIMEILVRKGPVGLLALAEDHGYVPETGYVSKCHLCHETRKALRRDYPEFLGPEAVYVE